MMYDDFERILQNELSIGNTGDANLLNCIHLNENDHTNILWQILQYKQDDKLPFLESFVKKVLGIDWKLCSLDNESKTQYPAIPGKGNAQNQKFGFIDLLLKNDDKVIIIENKVCGASDQNYQLARYYHSFVEMTDKNQPYYNSLKSAYGSYHKSHGNAYSKDNVYVVYLTEYGTLPKDEYVVAFQKQIGEHFVQASYFGSGEDDNKKSLLDWLKEDVLTRMPYVKSGRMLKSLLLYIDYLETWCNGDEEIKYGKSVCSFFKDKPLNELYKAFEDNESKELKREKGKEFSHALRYFINKKLNELLPNQEWAIFWTPAYLLIYKKTWNEIECGRRFCMVHWELLKHMSQKPDYSWGFHMEGKNLNILAKNDVWKKIFNSKKANGAGQFRNAFTLTPEQKEDSYILSLSDTEIKDYFGKLLNNDDFKILTGEAINTIKKLTRENITDPVSE